MSRPVFEGRLIFEVLRYLVSLTDYGQNRAVMAWEIKPLTRLVSAEGTDSVPQAYLENLIQGDSGSWLRRTFQWLGSISCPLLPWEHLRQPQPILGASIIWRRPHAVLDRYSGP